MAEHREIKRRPIRHGRTEEDVEAALQLVALYSGSSWKASEHTGIDESTIRYWRDQSFADRYRQIRAELVPKIQANLAAKHEDMALQALEKQAEALQHLDPEALKAKQSDLAKMVRDLSVTSAVHTDKTQLLRDRPTQITEHRSAADLLDSIARKFPQGIANADSEDITDVELAEGPGLPLSTGTDVVNAGA